MEKQSKYKEIYNILRRSIIQGIYEPGSLLPTEASLCKQYDISRTTVRKALAMLSKGGYIDSCAGRGSTVLNTTTSQRMNSISSVTESLRLKGSDIKVASIYVKKELCPENLMKDFGFKEPKYIYNVERIIYADGSPVAYLINKINAELAPNLDSEFNPELGLYGFLEKHYGITMTTARERITAVSATFSEASMLGISAGSPLLLSNRITYAGEKVLDVAMARLVSEKYEYEFYLRGR